MSKYKLLIRKKSARKALWRKENTGTLYFSVVDLEKGIFPSNWVCLFPKEKKSLVERSIFSKIFSNNPLKIAVELLTAARKEYSDLDIQQEIDLRLTIIRTQAVNL